MSQLSQLPLEIFEIILPQVGGYACISLRRTCKRIKMMVDEMEMRLMPCIWYRYAYTDFSKACIDSVLPLVKQNREGLDKRSHHWKIVYAGLCSSMKPHKVFFRKKAQISSSNRDVASTDISFSGAQLFINSHSSMLCVGLKHRVKSNLLLPITDLRYYKNDPHSEIKFLDSRHSGFGDNIIYKPFAIDDQANTTVEACKMMVQSKIQNFTESSSYEELICLHPKSPAVKEAIKRTLRYAEDRISHRRWTLIQYDDKILIGAFGKTLVFCHLTMDSGFVCSETELPHTIKSVHRLDHLLVVIVHDTLNNVFTNEMCIDDSGTVKVRNWSQLCLHENTSHIFAEKVCDADVVGYALVLVTDLGNLFLSSVEDPSHDAIQKKLYLALEFDRQPTSTDYLVCLDLNNGFTIAVLDENHQSIILLFAEW